MIEKICPLIMRTLETSELQDDEAIVFRTPVLSVCMQWHGKKYALTLALQSNE